MAYDRRRTAWLAQQGVSVVRLPATSIRDNLTGVLQGILARIDDQ